jgi:hypothetical protein
MEVPPENCATCNWSIEVVRHSDQGGTDEEDEVFGGADHWHSEGS